MKTFMENAKALRGFLILWLTQSLSALGSAMTAFALVVWSYGHSGSALETAMLSICSYAPYVLVSIFAGAVSDRWRKKTVMLVCDTFAALCTVCVGALLAAGRLELWHLYALNAASGLMNTFQQPASDVAITLLTPKEHYQLASSLRSFSGALNSILAPVLATALLALLGIRAVIAIDLTTFAAAFLSLVFLIRLPEEERREQEEESVLALAKSGIGYLRSHLGILHLMLFLAAINLIASMYNAALPALLLTRGGGEAALGAVQAAAGGAMLAGSLFSTIWPKPKSRVRVICNTLLISMSTENFLLAFGRTVPVWCVGAILGWAGIPLMNANMDVLFRERIPVAMQGRVYSARNTFQFFTIPIGYLLGGALVDRVFEPLMAAARRDGLLVRLFGMGKGAGAACLFSVLAVMGVATCLIFRMDRHIWALECPTQEQTKD